MEYTDIQMEKKDLQTLKDIAVKAYPYEACGVLTGGEIENRIYDIVDANNTAALDLRKKSFEISALDIYRLENDGYKPIGFYHSHPDYPAVLSEEDKKHMIPDMIYIVASVKRTYVSQLKGYVRTSTDLNQICELSIQIVDKGGK